LVTFSHQTLRESETTPGSSSGCGIRINLGDDVPGVLGLPPAASSRRSVPALPVQGQAGAARHRADAAGQLPSIAASRQRREVTRSGAAGARSEGQAIHLRYGGLSHVPVTTGISPVVSRHSSRTGPTITHHYQASSVPAAIRICSPIRHCRPPSGRHHETLHANCAASRQGVIISCFHQFSQDFE
jgi:hypothetical protein